jgi:transcriptional regulator with XRE-family HTH domain
MLHEALRLIRAYHDISQSQLSLELGISNSYLSELESGRKQPTLDLLNKYSERFGVPVSSLLFFSENIGAGITKNVRTVAAKKILTLLQWVENKNARETASQ